MEYILYFVQSLAFFRYRLTVPFLYILAFVITLCLSQLKVWPKSYSSAMDVIIDWTPTGVWIFISTLHNIIIEFITNYPMYEHNNACGINIFKCYPSLTILLWFIGCNVNAFICRRICNFLFINSK